MAAYLQLTLCSQGKSLPSRWKHIWLDSARHRTHRNAGTMYTGAACALPPRWRWLARHLYMHNRNPGLWEPRWWTAEMFARRCGAQRSYTGTRKAQRAWWWLFLRCRPDELESDGMLLPILSWRRVSGQQVVQSWQCAERDNGQGLSYHSEHDSRHGVSSRLLSWGRGGGAKPRGYRNAERCRFRSFPRTRISQLGGGPVLATVGAKWQVVRAWCGYDGL